MKRWDITLSEIPFQIRNFLILFVEHKPSPVSNEHVMKPCSPPTRHLASEQVVMDSGQHTWAR